MLLVVCATHGSGDIPTNILPLAETLERERPDLSGHRYGVIALGDMTYQDTFCGGGKKVDKVFELCGARKVGDRLEVDASSQPLPDEEALGWVEGWKAWSDQRSVGQGEDLDRLGHAAQRVLAERLQRHRCRRR